MNVLSLTMNTLAAVLQVYMLLLIIRIAVTWVQMDHTHAVIRILGRITDPYLNYFKRFDRLVVGGLDFSPVVALMVLNFFSSLAKMIGMYGQVSVGIVVSILIQLLWSAVGFFLFLLGLLAIFRFLSIQFRWEGQRLWTYFDAVLQRPTFWVSQKLRPGNFMPYATTLMILGLVCLGVWFTGEIVTKLATALLSSLPF